MQESGKDVRQAEAKKRQAREMEQMLKRMQREPYACLALPDASNRIRVKIEFLGGDKVVHEYAYDAAGHLTGVRRNGQVTEQYAYDDQGRRSADRCEARSMQERRHEYGPDDRLLRAGATAFEYDAMGRLERRKEPGQNDFICMYTPLGFLGAARLPDMRWVSYDRDGDGRRTAKQIDRKKVEGYGWDKQGRLAWFFDDLARETSWFEYGDEEARLPVFMKRGGQRYMLGWNQVCSLRAVIDGQGRVVKEIEYDAFGNILRETAPELRIPFGFAGGLHDRDTGLIRYRFRDYFPDIGRFTAKDPIGYKGGDSDLYGYCLDDPVNGVDPSGLRVLKGESYIETHLFPRLRGLSSGLAVDGEGNVGANISDNMGVSLDFPSLSAGHRYSWTNHDTVSDLSSDTATSSGGGVNIPLPWVPFVSINVGGGQIDGEQGSGEYLDIGASLDPFPFPSGYLGASEGRSLLDAASDWNAIKRVIWPW